MVRSIVQFLEFEKLYVILIKNININIFFNTYLQKL